MNYDAILLVSFGGPEAPEQVIPFLENVLRGREVPRERVLEVAEHYHRFGGRSPINDQNRLVVARLRELLAAEGPDLPVYWGNRNWEPYLADAVAQMRSDGVQRAAAFVTSAFSSYSGCRQYKEDIERARAAVGEGAPEIDKLRVFWDHPGFLETMIDNTRAAIEALRERKDLRVVFTAHSIPASMARTSRYEEQIGEASRRVAEALGLENWSVAWQSRSGPPSQPWLEPDVLDVLETTRYENVVIVPIGFVSDHMEVVYDLDEEAAGICAARGIQMKRAATVGADPRFIGMIRDLVKERAEHPERAGCLAANCCPAPVRLAAGRQ